MLIVGFVGFLTYFAVILVISTQNEKTMTSVLDEKIPAIEVLDGLASSLSRVQEVVAPSAVSVGMEGVANLEVANKRVAYLFERLSATGGFSAAEAAEIAEMKRKYAAAYEVLSKAFSGVVAGLNTLSSVQVKLQRNNMEVAAISSWAANMKKSKNTDLRASIDAANLGSERLVIAGLVMILAGIPFAMLFYFTTRNVIQSLKNVSEKLNTAVTDVLSISSEASESSSRLAAASSQQAAAVTESVSSMDEMKSMLGQTVEHSGAALRSSEESYHEAASGQKVIDELRIAMLDIERAYEELEEVNRVVSSIRAKTNVINDIVFKTQLLSFNASIEAARAGQHGRGFSVVAAEVGKLAEVSGVAAQEIGKLLDQSTKKVAQIVQSTKFKVESANQMSLRCATVFESITHRTGEARTMVDAITTAAAEQEAGIQQVSRAMIEMKDSSDQTDTMAHNIQKLSDSLREQSRSLAATMQKLDVLVHGESGLDEPAGRPSAPGGAAGTGVVRKLFPSADKNRRSA
ncbi:MAG: hypothetical protein J0L82_05315 [Deltaproteobacteria bacterium]|nr:hypothetical protein [Deltaproteobacteria bacterium]